MPPEGQAAPPNPAAQPGAAPGQSQGQPPFGSSPATGPTQNKGHEVAGMKKIGLILDAIAETVPLVGAASEAGQALTEAMRKLAKFVPPGAVSPADKMNATRATMMKQQQQGAMMKQLQSGGGAAGGAPGGALPAQAAA